MHAISTITNPSGACLFCVAGPTCYFQVLKHHYFSVLQFSLSNISFLLDITSSFCRRTVVSNSSLDFSISYSVTELCNRSCKLSFPCLHFSSWRVRAWSSDFIAECWFLSWGQFLRCLSRLSFSLIKLSLSWSSWFIWFCWSLFECADCTLLSFSMAFTKEISRECTVFDWNVSNSFCMDFVCSASTSLSWSGQTDASLDSPRLGVSVKAVFPTETTFQYCL